MFHVSEMVEKDNSCPLVARYCMSASKGRTTIVRGRHDATVFAPQDMWERAQKFRALLRSRGLGRGDVLAIGAQSGAEVLAAILAAWADGIAISLFPHEVAERGGRLAPSKFVAMLEVVKPRCLLLEDSLVQHVPQEMRSAIIPIHGFDHLLADCVALHEVPHAHPEDVAILQFTSGSTGIPKAAVITQAMLSANCAGIQSRVGVNNSDRMVSWLPMHHDMGLSAITLAWWSGIDLVLIPTALFVRQPLIWLQAISQYRGTLSPSSASAYGLLTRLAPSAARLQLDLSSWRYAWAGAEPVFDKHLCAFVKAMQPFGLRPAVVQPSYGMAEAVVAVSLNVPGQPYRAIWVDRESLDSSGVVQLCDAHAAGAAVYVSNGTAIDGVEIRVVGPNGETLKPYSAGVTQIRGACVIQHYVGLPSVGTSDGWYDTGDIGFLIDNEVFISGRAKDLITRAGLNVSPQTVEWAIEDLLELVPGSVAAFSYLDAIVAQERVIAVVARQSEQEEAGSLRNRIAQAVVNQTGIQLDEIIFMRRAHLPKTTSGKVQRSELRRAYLQGELRSSTSAASYLAEA